jgi:hypothetical protein
MFRWCRHADAGEPERERARRATADLRRVMRLLKPNTASLRGRTTFEIRAPVTVAQAVSQGKLKHALARSTTKEPRDCQDSERRFFAAGIISVRMKMSCSPPRSRAEGVRIVSGPM